MSDGNISDDGFDGAFDEEFGTGGEDSDCSPALSARQADASVAQATQEEQQHAPHAVRSSHAASTSSRQQASGSGDKQRQVALSPSSSRSCIPMLPREVLVRVLSFLSAQDLTAIGACSRMLRGTAEEDVLWRRLFCARWGKPRQPVVGSASWKGRYVDADNEEFSQTVLAAPDELRAVFSNMQRAKRQTCLSKALVDDTAELPQCQRTSKLAEWRRAKGFSDCPVPRPDLARSTVRFHRIEPDTFVCEETGWTHLCDHTCREGIVDAESGLLTCPVSGRTSLRLVTECEELSMQQRSVDACFTVADQELQCFSLGRAYTEGYYADAKEMRTLMKRRYGIKLR